ncbi:MAG: hypothetical protein C5B57_12295 [Blastocatellia bacterium]|nr:MAG: hypothetical protein C5B57_12295 [Blastocatellia bacterium]
MSKPRTFLTCVTVAVVSLVTTVGAVSFRATISSIKLQARPGQVLTRQFQLALDNDQPRTHFKAHIEDWWRSEDGKQSFYAAPGTLKHSCGEWIAVNPVESAVDAGQTLTVRLTVTVSTDAEPGGHWCVLTLDEIPDPLAQPDGVGVKFVASVSTGIFVDIDPVERAAKITDVVVSPSVASVKLRNEGNTPIGVEGRFEFVRPGDSHPYAVAAIPRAPLLTEPIKTGVFTADLPDASVLPSGRYIVRAIVDIGVDHYIGVERELDLKREVPATADARPNR